MLHGWGVGMAMDGYHGRVQGDWDTTEIVEEVRNKEWIIKWSTRDLSRTKKTAKIYQHVHEYGALLAANRTMGYP